MRDTSGHVGYHPFDLVTDLVVGSVVGLGAGSLIFCWGDLAQLDASASFSPICRGGEVPSGKSVTDTPSRPELHRASAWWPPVLGMETHISRARPVGGISVVVEVNVTSYNEVDVMSCNPCS